MIQLTLAYRLSKIKTDRAAVIPYVVINEYIYFLLGIDGDSGDVTDFGGGVKQYEYSLSAAIREFKEESDGIFGDMYDDVNGFNTNITLLNGRMCTIFVPIASKWFEEAEATFKKKNASGTNDEVTGVLWVREDEFRAMLRCYDSRMWTKLKGFYRTGFTQEVSRALKITYSRTY